MSLLEVLDILICRNSIFSFLQTNDVLRMRRVSKSSKNAAEDFITIKKIKTQRRLEIIDYCFHEDHPFGECDTLIEKFRGLPLRTNVVFSYLTSKYNSDPSNATLRHFVEQYASHVTHLTIQTVYARVETCLFQSFPNITHLVLGDVRQGGKDERLSKQLDIPFVIKNLKSLKILECWILDENVLEFVGKIVESSIQNLEELQLPFNSLLDQTSQANVANLARMCLFTPSKVKLINVSGRLIDILLSTDNRTPEIGPLDEMIKAINFRVRSIRCPEKMSFLQELPKLEEIDFETTVTCTIPDGGFAWRSWPKLKKISVFFVDDGSAPQFNQVWDFLFYQLRRENVAELTVNFSGFEEPNESFPKTLDIVRSCPNLKILSLPAHCKEFFSLPELWRGFPFLEKVSLRHCINLKTYDFVGADPNKPLIWNLKHLKTLEFWGMDAMMLTDELFSRVLCQMELKTLYLSSDDVVQIITLDGIRSLLTGKFANSIEKFSMENLQLKNVTEEEKKSVEKLFRSSKMI